MAQLIVLHLKQTNNREQPNIYYSKQCFYSTECGRFCFNSSKLVTSDTFANRYFIIQLLTDRVCFGWPAQQLYLAVGSMVQKNVTPKFPRNVLETSGYKIIPKIRKMDYQSQYRRLLLIGAFKCLLQPAWWVLKRRKPLPGEALKHGLPVFVKVNQF